MIFVVDKTSESETIYQTSGNQRYNRWSDGGLKCQAENPKLLVFSTPCSIEGITLW